MTTCFRHSFILRQKFLLLNKTSLKFFSAISPVCDKVSKSKYNYNQHTYNKLNYPNQVQCRYFSFDGLQPFYDLLTSDNGSNIFRTLLIEAHDYTGLPWWGILISAAAAMKVLIGLPCAVAQQHISSKLDISKSELDVIVKGLKSKIILEAKKNNWTQKRVEFELRNEVRKQWRNLVVKYNCHPFKNFILFITQFPFWLGATLGIKEMANVASVKSMANPVAELQFLVGGPFWCPNLSVPDPLLILPIINALVLLAITEMNLLQSQVKIGNMKQTFFAAKVLPNIFRLFAVIFFLVSSMMPSGLSLFWVSSSTFTLIQNLFLLMPRVRRFLRVPLSPSELDKPYRQLWAKFCSRFSGN